MSLVEWYWQHFGLCNRHTDEISHQARVIAFVCIRHTTKWNFPNSMQYSGLPIRNYERKKNTSTHNLNRLIFQSSDYIPFIATKINDQRPALCKCDWIFPYATTKHRLYLSKKVSQKKKIDSFPIYESSQFFLYRYFIGNSSVVRVWNSRKSVCLCVCIEHFQLPHKFALQSKWSIDHFLQYFTLRSAIIFFSFRFLIS